MYTTYQGWLSGNLMMSKLDEYISILGIGEDFKKLKAEAKEKALAEAWRKYSRKWHPDVNNSPEAEEKFKLGNEANEWLKNYIKDENIEDEFDDLYEDLGKTSYYDNKKTKEENDSYRRYNWENFVVHDDASEEFVITVKILVTFLIIIIAVFLSSSYDEKNKETNHKTYQNEQVKPSYTKTTTQPLKVQPPSQNSETSQKLEDSSTLPSNQEHKQLNMPPYFQQYMRDIEKNIKLNWKPPKNNVSKRTVLTFRLGKNGELLAINVSKSSGSEETDNAAIAAVKMSAPFEPLPVEFKGNSVDIDFTFDYKVLGQ